MTRTTSHLIPVFANDGTVRAYVWVGWDGGVSQEFETCSAASWARFRNELEWT